MKLEVLGGRFWKRKIKEWSKSIQQRLRCPEVLVHNKGQAPKLMDLT